MNRRYLPIVFAVLATLYLLSAVRAPRTGDHALGTFGNLPVVDQGRIKPLDTLARISLMVLSNRQQFYWKRVPGAGPEGTPLFDGTADRDEQDGHARTPAVRWLLDVMAHPAQARDYRVVRIDHPEVLSLIGPTGSEVFEEPGVASGPNDRQYFSINEVLRRRESLNEQMRKAHDLPANQRSPFHRALLRLSQQLNTYLALEDVVGLILVPPAAGSANADWRTVAQAAPNFQSDALNPTVERYVAALTAWHQEQPAEFNAAVHALAATISTEHGPVAEKMGFETTFNRVSPFIRAAGLYVLALLLVLFSWLAIGSSAGWARALAKSALAVIVVAWIAHTLGLAARIYMQGRPPVTNLYSSAIFVSWGAVLLGAILERFYKNGVGAITAAVTGFLSLLVAHHLSLDGDTMTMMQAVLDTNFWLATHVIVITLGYSATFLAGTLGVIYILRGVLTRALVKEEARNLNRMIYGIICFATLFSFVGTILGGIWADQSWGRFWGWDPKENGALLIVLWNALVLHARWGGIARQRGLAVLAVAGNIVTAWSWFGTNMLGVGLHAYGFIDSAVFWMLVFVASQLAIMALGMVPLDRWRSRSARTTERAAAPGQPAELAAHPPG